MGMKNLFRAVAVLVLGLAACQAQAGVEIIGQEGMTTLVSNGQLRSQGLGPHDPTHIFDVNHRKVTIIYPAKEIYATGTPKEYCQALHNLQEEMKSQMSDEERRMVEEFMRGLREKTKKHPQVRVEDRGQGERIAGYPTEHFAVYVDQNLTEEVWLSEDPSLLGEFGDYTKLMDMTAEISRCISSAMGIPGGSLEEQPAYQDLMDKGVELKSVEYTDGSANTEQVQDVSERSIKEAQFQPPEGFKKTSIKEVMKAQQDEPNGP